MSRYHVMINTDGFVLFPCSKKNWEPGTINDFIQSINGWKSTERSLQEIRWRIELLLQQAHYHYGNPKWEQWFAKKKNKITYRDRLCGFDRTNYISVPGFPQGYVDIDKLLNELKEKGSVRIPFSMGYNIRQAHSKRFQKCFVEIRKETPENSRKKEGQVVRP